MFLVCFVLLFSANCLGQEKEIFFLLEKDNPEYVFIVNGDKQYDNNAGQAEKFFITSTENYSGYLRDKKKYLKDNSPNLPGLSFKVKKKKNIKASEVKNLYWIDYNWLTENSRIQSEELIELNAYKNLYLVLKEGDEYYSYDVVIKFSSD